MRETVERFLEYILLEKNYSNQTAVSYRDTLSGFCSFVEKRDPEQSLQELDGDWVREWFTWLLEQGEAITSLHKRKSILQSFFRYTRMMKLMDRDPMLKVNIPRKPKRLPEFIREEELDRLFDEVDFGSDFEGVRNRLILNMLYALGIRRAELTGLLSRNVDRAQQQIKVLGKRNKERIIPYGRELDELIDDYLRVRNNEIGQTDYFFVRPSGEPIYAGIVYEVVKRYLSLVTSAKKRSPHVLRHSFATAMLNNGSDIRAIKEILGHSTLTSTEVYTHSSFEQLKEVYLQAHPRGDEES